MSGQADLFKRPRPTQANAVRVAVPTAPEPVRSPAYWEAYYAARAEHAPPASRGPNACAVCDGAIGQLTPATPVDGAWMHDDCWRQWWTRRSDRAHAAAKAATAGKAAA